MICYNCGHELKEGVKFCTFCGKSLNVSYNGLYNNQSNVTDNNRNNTGLNAYSNAASSSNTSESNAYSNSALNSKNFDDVVTNKVEFDEANINSNIETAIGMVEAAEHEVTGLIMAPACKNALAQLKKGSSSYEALYPELGWGAVPGTLNGLPIDSNSTVSFGSNADRAIVGNFRDYFKWGFGKNIVIEVIEYGDPDNTGRDLKGYNEVYLRGEAYIGWGILVPSAFAKIRDEDPASV